MKHIGPIFGMHLLGLSLALALLASTLAVAQPLSAAALNLFPSGNLKQGVDHLFGGLPSLLHDSAFGQYWSWTRLGFTVHTATDAAMVTTSDGALHVFYIDEHHRLIHLHRKSDDPSWGSDLVDGPPEGFALIGPSAVSWVDGERITVFAHDTHFSIVARTYYKQLNSWGIWEHLGGVSDDRTAAVYNT